MGAWRIPVVVVMLWGLCACVGAQHQLPLVSDQEVFVAQAEIEQSAALKPVGRTPAQNQALLAAVARKLEASAGPICGLEDYSPCRFTVVYDPTDEVNAYATEDGRVVVNEGLLRYLASEDEVAAVVGHEMGHHLAGHIEKGQINAAVGQAVSMILVSALVVALGGDASAVNSSLDAAGSVGASVGHLSFSKEHEREADYIGAYLLARAGYDLDKARRLWVQLTRSSGNMQTDMFDTHPSGPERLAAWNQTVAEVRASDDLLPDLK